jgi:hydrogenase maturation protease
VKVHFDKADDREADDREAGDWKAHAREAHHVKPTGKTGGRVPWHIIGVGSPVVGDGLGWAAIEALRAAGLADAHELLTLDRPGPALIEHLTPGTCVILLDAMEAGLAPGSVRELDLEDLIAMARPPSSHHLGLAETLALARTLGVWPQQLHLLGIQTVPHTADADSGDPDSDTVGTDWRQRACADVVARVRVLLEAHPE